MRVLFANLPFTLSDDGYIDLNINESTIEGIRKKPINIGDALICEATLRIFNKATKISNIQLGRKYKKEHLKKLAKSHDLLVIRGGNYFAEFHDVEPWLDIVKEIDLPIAMFGVGAQSAHSKDYKLPEGTIKFLKHVEKNAIAPIGTRGKYSSHIFYINGIKNTLPLGCPTMVRNANASIKVKKKKIKNWGFTPSRFLAKDYCRSEAMNKYTHNASMAHILEDSRATVISQGVVEECMVGFGSYNEKDLESIFKGYNIDSSYSVGEVVSKFYAPNTTKEWEKYIMNLDYLWGFRVHGNIIGYSLGIPTLFVDYDSRTKELIELLGATFVSIEDAFNGDISKVSSQIDVSSSENAYTKIYAEWKHYLDYYFKDYSSFLTAKPGTFEEPVESKPVKYQNQEREIVRITTEVDEMSQKLWPFNSSEHGDRKWGYTE